MDDADRAKTLEEQEIARGLSVIPRFTGEAAEECVDCGSEIPIERRMSLPGIEHCVDCATAIEAQERLRA